MRISHKAAILMTVISLSAVLSSCIQTKSKESTKVAPTTTSAHVNIIPIDSIYLHDLEVELNDTRQNIRDIEKHTGGVWYKGDKEFYGHWYSGLMHEKEADYDSAQHYYRKALAIRRHEMGTYYIKYPLGRVLLLNGDTLQGCKFIKQFINDVTYEIEHLDEQEWRPSTEAVNGYQQEIKEAKHFLIRYNSR